MYLKLVDYYLYRKNDSIEAGLKLANEKLWLERKTRSIPHSLEQRVDVVRKLLALSRKKNLHLSDYLKTHLKIDGNFLDSCLKHLAQVSAE